MLAEVGIQEGGSSRHAVEKRKPAVAPGAATSFSTVAPSACKNLRGREPLVRTLNPTLRPARASHTGKLFAYAGYRVAKSLAGY